MFTLISATIFLAAFLLAATTITSMLALYRDKMVAALLFEPISQEPPVYRVRTVRRRVGSGAGTSDAIAALAPAYA